MKTISALLIAVIVLAAFKSQNQPSAIVDRLYGLDIYVHSSPVREYEVVGEGYPAYLGGCKNAVMAQVKAAAKVPNANAVLVDISSGRFKAIKYKN